MVYTLERLIAAVREVGHDGQPFTLGAVRAQLGLTNSQVSHISQANKISKAREKRELKRFRSCFRECTHVFGDKLEKLGPNTYRLKDGQPVATHAVPLPTAQRPQTPPPVAKHVKPERARKAPPPPPPPRSRKPAAAESEPGLWELSVQAPTPLTETFARDVPTTTSTTSTTSTTPSSTAPTGAAAEASRVARQSAVAPEQAGGSESDSAARLIDRVGISPRRDRTRAGASDEPAAEPLSTSGTFAPQSPDAETQTKPDVPVTAAAASRRQRETPEDLLKGLPPKHKNSSGLGAKLSSMFGRSKSEAHPNKTKTAATALSRLAVDLQPKAANFEYHWDNGELQVKRAGPAAGK